MKNILYIFVFLISVACVAQKNRSKEWVGTTDVDKVSQNFPWFQEGYKSYNPDTAYTSKLKTRIDNYTILVFGGTWCGDTKNLLPKFYKSADASGISKDKIQLYLLNTNKKSPKKLEKQYNITSIPTFILLKDGKEAGRVVESVENSIEEELTKLIKE